MTTARIDWRGQFSARASLLLDLLLIALWLLFFWRLLTPVSADQASLTQGDFSAQFVAFAGYQFTRFSEGGIPLWNPYNNGGLPFIADTQAAVFYPPRLITLALSAAFGGWTYQALQFEMMAHVLAFTLLMKRLISAITGQPLAGFVGAVIAGYGGFLSGYPPLQLALLEAAVWLPAALLGVHSATRDQRLRLFPLIVGGAMLGMSWLAGHPQTSFFLTHLLIAYLAFRTISVGGRWWWFIVGGAILGTVAIGLSVVQLLPGIEYLALTTRVDFGFDAKANGFPLHDVVGIVLPNVVSLFSPLYIGAAGLALAIVGALRGGREAFFWSGVAIVALLWSFGGNSVVYQVLYNLLPGLRYFRGQERAAYLVANSAAILAGMGVAALLTWDGLRDQRIGLRLRLLFSRASSALAIGAALIGVAWIGNPSAYGTAISAAALTVTSALVANALIGAAIGGGRRTLLLSGLALWIVIDLFTVNLNADAVYDPIPASDQAVMRAPAYLRETIAAPDDPFRIDGQRGLGGNIGSLWGIADVRGISPLWLGGAYALIESGVIPTERMWEVFAVRYVVSDWQSLAIPTTIRARGADDFGEVNLHRLDDPRPFALLIYRAAPVNDDEQAYGLLRDPSFDPRRTIVVESPTQGVDAFRDPDPVTDITLRPEHITIRAQVDRPAFLSLALVDHPGWRAFIDEAEAPLVRAYGGVSALFLPPGDHAITLRFDPLSYRIGALSSLFTLGGLIILILIRTARASTIRARSQTR